MRRESRKKGRGKNMGKCMVGEGWGLIWVENWGKYGGMNGRL